MQEEWKQYKNTAYHVSNTGYIMNMNTLKMLATTKTRQGYMRLNLWHDGRSTNVAVHRLIAEVFLPNPENKQIVNHIDGNPSNNRLENLEWSTIQENVEHAYATGLSKRGEDCTVAKLTEAQVLEIIECMRNSQTVAQTAKQFNMSAAAISNIWNGKTWKHLIREKPATKNYKGKLKVTDVPIIRALFKEGYDDTNIANRYGLNRASIYNIRIGKNWSNY